MKLDLDTIMEAISRDEFIGFCRACGAEHFGVDPDGREDLCEACGQREVYGAEELLLMEAF